MSPNNVAWRRSRHVLVDVVADRRRQYVVIRQVVERHDAPQVVRHVAWSHDVTARTGNSCSTSRRLALYLVDSRVPRYASVQVATRRADGSAIS